jgi:hypothetical protein
MSVPASSCGRYVAGGWVGGEPAGPAVAVAQTSTLAATAQPTLRMGSRGAAVVSLQRRLATLAMTWVPSTASSAPRPTTAWSPSRRSMAWSVTGSWGHGPGRRWHAPSSRGPGAGAGLLGGGEPDQAGRLPGTERCRAAHPGRLHRQGRHADPDRQLRHGSPHRRLAAEQPGPVTAAQLLLAWRYRARLNLGARLSGQPRVCAGDGPGDEPSGPPRRIGMPVSVYR